MRINYFFYFSETKRVRRTLITSFGLAMMLALLLLLGSQVTTRIAYAATTFIVTSTGDKPDENHLDGRCQTTTAGECTVRAAIQQANATKAADTINFAIPGVGPHTISPAEGLPPITRPLTIDGYTQNGATPNTLTEPDKTNAVLKIQLTGSHAGLSLREGASNSVIRGLAIGGCRVTNSCIQAIRLSLGKGYKIQGNFLGTLADGTTPDSNSYGVGLDFTSDSTIGGTDADDGKLDGVVEARNIISGSGINNVDILPGSSGNRIEGNLIGPDKNGSSLSNLRHGIRVSGPGSNGNRILSNSIFSNTGLGIDLEGGDETTIGFGVTTNDPKDPDTGPNRLQNFPVITSAQNPGNFTSISWTLDRTPSTKKKKRTFIIQFFSNPTADPSTYGEGKTFLGQIQVKTDRQGHAESGDLPFSPPQKVPKDEYITATATNKKTGDTSEFSEARKVIELVIGGP